jgi:hypothetical protein
VGQLDNYLLKSFEIDSLAVYGVHFEVFGDDVFGNNGGQFEEMAEKHEFLEVHGGKFLFEVIESCVLV